MLRISEHFFSFLRNESRIGPSNTVQASKTQQIYNIIYLLASVSPQEYSYGYHQSSSAAGSRVFLFSVLSLAFAEL